MLEISQLISKALSFTGLLMTIALLYWNSVRLLLSIPIMLFFIVLSISFIYVSPFLFFVLILFILLSTYLFTFLNYNIKNNKFIFTFFLIEIILLITVFIISQFLNHQIRYPLFLGCIVFFNFLNLDIILPLKIDNYKQNIKALIFLVGLISIPLFFISINYKSFNIIFIINLLALYILAVNFTKNKIQIVLKLNKKYRERLFYSEKEYIKIFENSPGLNVILDKDYKIVDCNTKFMEIVGLEIDNILKKKLTDFIPLTFHSKMDLLEKYLKFHKEASGEFALVNKSKKDSIDVFLSAIKDANGIFIIMQDITTIKWMQISLTSYAEQLKKEMDNAKVADRMKSVFLANMSHEIRTPLTSIIGFSSLLKETPLSTTQLDYLNKINNSGEHLLKIINDIIDLSKIEAGKLDIEFEKVNLNKIFKEIYDAMYPQVFKKDIELQMHISEEIQKYFILLDGFRLKQVLINLIANAIKFTDKGFVAFRSSKSEDHILFFIQDTGIGIPKNKLSKVFDPFVQAEDTLARKYGGTGLGLAISKNLVKLMGGTIEINSEEGKGTVITLKFPSSIITNEIIQAEDLTTFKSSIHPDELSDDYKSMKIKPEEIIKENLDHNISPELLVGEDNDSVYILLDFIFKKHKIKAIRGKDKDEITQIFNQHKESIKCVLMDINIPKGNGIDLAEEFKAIKPEISVIGFSAYHYEELKDKIEGILDDYIKKPFKINEIYNIISQYL